MIRLTPIQRPTVYPNPRPKATEPTLKQVEESAGTPNWFKAFRMPMACADSATSSRNGNITRVSVTAN